MNGATGREYGSGNSEMKFYLMTSVMEIVSPIVWPLRIPTGDTKELLLKSPVTESHDQVPDFDYPKIL